MNNTVFFGSYACILVFVTVYAQEILKFSSTQIGFFYTAAAAAMLVVRLTTAKIGDRMGPLYLLIPGHVMIMLGLFLLANQAKNSYVVFLLVGALYGAGQAICTPAFNACTVTDGRRYR